MRSKIFVVMVAWDIAFWSTGNLEEEFVYTQQSRAPKLLSFVVCHNLNKQRRKTIYHLFYKLLRLCVDKDKNNKINGAFATLLPVPMGYYVILLYHKSVSSPRVSLPVRLLVTLYEGLCCPLSVVYWKDLWVNDCFLWLCTFLSWMNNATHFYCSNFKQ